MDRLESFGRVRAVDVENHRVTVVVSTDDVGRDGMVIDQAGWLFDAYDQNPTVLWNHEDEKPALAMAIPELRTLTEHALTEVHEFDDGDPVAMDLFRKIQRGFVRATSVRWNPLMWEFRKARHEGEDDSAIADYGAAIEFKPDFGEAYFNRGLVYEARRDRDQAIADFQVADRLLPYHRSIKTKLRKLGLWPSSESQ